MGCLLLARLANNLVDEETVKVLDVSGSISGGLNLTWPWYLFSFSVYTANSVKVDRLLDNSRMKINK